MVHHALDAGINLVDTADACSQGGSEEIIGRAIAGRRDRWHVPDGDVAAEETLPAVDDLGRSGKAGTVGSSEFSAESIAPGATADAKPATAEHALWTGATVKIVVCVKYVPDAQEERKFTAADGTTDRVGVPGLLSELDEHAVEEALKLKDSGGGEVIALTMGPEKAIEAVRKALQMGADKGVHVRDDALHGSDAPATSLVLAEAIRKISEDGAVDLVLAGMASTDGNMSVVPAMLAERLGLPQVTFASELSVDAGVARIRRDGDLATDTIEARLPAVVSVTDQINEPRYPSFKGIMAAKKKPVVTWDLGDLGLSAEQLGLSGAWTRVESFTARPPRQQGEIVTDEGDGGLRLAEFLIARKFA